MVLLARQPYQANELPQADAKGVPEGLKEKVLDSQACLVDCIQERENDDAELVLQLRFRFSL